jgi:hypothetical protein
MSVDLPGGSFEQEIFSSTFGSLCLDRIGGPHRLWWVHIYIPQFIWPDQYTYRDRDEYDLHVGWEHLYLHFHRDHHEHEYPNEYSYGHRDQDRDENAYQYEYRHTHACRDSQTGFKSLYQWQCDDHRGSVRSMGFNQYWPSLEY